MVVVGGGSEGPSEVVVVEVDVDVDVEVEVEVDVDVVVVVFVVVETVVVFAGGDGDGLGGGGGGSGRLRLGGGGGGGGSLISRVVVVDEDWVGGGGALVGGGGGLCGVGVGASGATVLPGELDFSAGGSGAFLAGALRRVGYVRSPRSEVDASLAESGASCVEPDDAADAAATDSVTRLGSVSRST